MTNPTNQHFPIQHMRTTEMEAGGVKREIKRERGKGEGPWEGGGSQKELGKGPGVVDLQRCWGCDEQSYKG